jgi:hypothetical protein
MHSVVLILNLMPTDCSLTGLLLVSSSLFSHGQHTQLGSPMRRHSSSGRVRLGCNECYCMLLIVFDVSVFSHSRGYSALPIAIRSEQPRLIIHQELPFWLSRHSFPSIPWTTKFRSSTQSPFCTAGSNSPGADSMNTVAVPELFEI